jgi:hypothetical protein
MKLLKIILTIVFLFTLCTFAQQEKEGQKKDQTSKSTDKQAKEKVSNIKKAKFIDLNGDGLNDNTQNKKITAPDGKHDKFVDKDGDGLNDNRVQGMGWDKKGKQKPFGKHGR